MTSLPKQTEKKLGLAIDLDTCVGCHACVISCKEWNTSNYGAPLSDIDAYGEDPVGVFLNRVHTYEIEVEEKFAQVVHFPKSCLHCDNKAFGAVNYGKCRYYPPMNIEEIGEGIARGLWPIVEYDDFCGKFTES